MLSETLLLLSSLNITVCQTDDCRNVAKLLSSGMNESMDPCENFYEYVCGSWSTSCPVTEKSPICTIDSDVEDAIDLSLREILEKNTNDDNMALSMEKEWYKACIDQERINEKGYAPVTEYLKNIGGWPMIMNLAEWNEKEFPWQKVAQYYATIAGKYSLFTIDQFLNPNNTEVKIIMFRPLDGVQLEWSYDIEEDYDEDDDDFYYYYYGKLGKFGNNYAYKYDNKYNDKYDDNNDDDYDDEETEKIVIDLIEKYAKSLGVNVEKISQQVTEILEFETALYNITIEAENNKSRSVMTVDEFQKFYDSHEPGNSNAKIDWLEMIHALSNNSGIDIDGSEKILVSTISYFEKLIPVLKETPGRIIVNYIHWLFFRDSLIYLHKDAGFIDIEDYMERWEYCIKHMEGLYFNTGSSQAFVENYFSDDLRQSASEMAEEIRSQVELDMTTSTWLDDESKALVKEKLHSMKFHIGYPDFYKNTSILNHFYDGLKIGQDYYENVINMLTFDNDEFWREFKEPFDKNQFILSPTLLNAFYNEIDNSLTIPAAEIIVPLFNSTLPLSLKYGYLGFTIGHEINHGFDNYGRKFDKNGNKLPWWTEKLINKYEDNARCFIDQFDEYGTNGTLTQNENIADSAGLLSAFESYKKKLKKGNMDDSRLPGLEGLNGEQLFFVSFAASLCTSATEEIVEYWMENDEHSIEPYRVNGAVANLKEFSEAFRCSKNSPMNPDNKCLLWK